MLDLFTMTTDLLTRLFDLGEMDRAIIEGLGPSGHDGGMWLVRYVESSRPRSALVAPWAAGMRARTTPAAQEAP